MRLLHVTPFYEPAWAFGGMARAAACLCRALAELGHEVTVATARLDPAHPSEERAGGVRVRRFEASLRHGLVTEVVGLGRFLAGALPAVDAAHVHGHRSGLAVVAARALRKAGTPWVLQTHGTFPDHGQRRLAKRAFDRLFGDRVVSAATALAAVSAAEAADLPRPARVIPNGVQPIPVAPGGAESERLSAGRTGHQGGQNLLFVGSDRPQKRGHALSGLLAALPRLELCLVGPFGPGFRRGFRSSEGRVRFEGVLEGAALREAYAAAALLVHPAVGEAFGLAPFEAALHGTAAVVAGGHGCGDWYGRAGGCVVPPDDPPALLAAVRARLEDRALAAREAAAVADFARRELTWESAARQMAALYGELRRSQGAA